MKFQLTITLIFFFISELYLDGNNLECIGIINLLQMFVDKAEQESIERKANVLSQSAVGLFTANAPIS